MRLQLRKPTQALNKAYAGQAVSQERLDVFRQALNCLFGCADETAPEARQRLRVAAFLEATFYEQTGSFVISHEEGRGLVVQSKEYPQRVLINVQSVYAGEMMTTLKNNVRSLHELILAYFDACEQHPVTSFSQLTITDTYNWFLIEEKDFRRLFYENSRLRKLYQIRQQQQKDPLFFYAETARILRDLKDELPVTCLNLRELAAQAQSVGADSIRKLLVAYKLFSPQHLFKLPFANNADSLNRAFYNELLYLLGLQEVRAEGRTMLQRLPLDEQQRGALLENTIHCLQTQHELAMAEEQVFDVALELCLTWLSRLLFLKLLEGHQMHFYANSREVQFLTPRHIQTFAELNELFFKVVAVPETSRSGGVANRFDRGRPRPIPHLNIDLFEPTELERDTLVIGTLPEALPLSVFPETILQNAQGERQNGALPALQYLLSFLDAFDFSPTGSATVPLHNKPPMSAAMLGPVLEKLNGYRDGSTFTPGSVINYLAGDLIRRAVLSRFNAQYGWTCTDLPTLTTELGQLSVAEANALINSLRLVDPAVGSGRFLTAALHQLIALKASLGILVDAGGRGFQQYQITVENDELLLTDEEGVLFEYRQTVRGWPSEAGAAGPRSECQRVQETLFREKQLLLENCLFGVDTSRNALLLCRLRLWIDLLQSAYYERGSMVCLPSLTANLKAGNALLSRLSPHVQLDLLRSLRRREPLLQALAGYRKNVQRYRRCPDPMERESLRKRITQFAEQLRQVVAEEDKTYTDIRQLEVRLAQSSLPFSVESEANGREQLLAQLEIKKAAFANRQEVYQQAFEWRFAFPEILDDAGNYAGFDVVLGQPPSDRSGEGRAHKELFSKLFPETYAPSADLYPLFIERGVSLLKPGGRLGYLVPDQWMQGTSGRRLRNWLRTIAVEQLIRFGESLAITDKATTNACIVSIRHAEPKESFQTAQVTRADWFGRPFGELSDYLSQLLTFVSVSSLETDYWHFPDHREQKVLTKLRQAGQPLGDYAKAPIFYGLQTGLSEAFVIDAKTRKRLLSRDLRSEEVIRPFCASYRLSRYQSPEINRFLIRFERGVTARQRGELEPEEWLSRTYPAVYEWLKPFEAKAFRRKHSGMYWWELPASAHQAEVDRPHLLVPTVANEFICVWAGAGLCASEKVISIGTADRFLLGLLNSTVAGYFVRQICRKNTRGGLLIRASELMQIPVPPATAAQQAAVSAWVTQILAAKAANPTTDTRHWEGQIDQLVGSLYGLTNEDEQHIKLTNEQGLK